MNVGNFVPRHVMEYYETIETDNDTEYKKCTRQPYKAMSDGKPSGKLVYDSKSQTQKIVFTRNNNRDYFNLNMHSKPLQNIVKHEDNFRNIENSYKNKKHRKKISDKYSPFASKIQHDLK